MKKQLIEGTPQWSKAWSLLANDKLNNGDPACKNENGEAWQYMGPNVGGQCFRHRQHPATNKREYITVTVE